MGTLYNWWHLAALTVSAQAHRPADSRLPAIDYLAGRDNPHNISECSRERVVAAMFFHQTPGAGVYLALVLIFARLGLVMTPRSSSTLASTLASGV